MFWIRYVIVFSRSAFKRDYVPAFFDDWSYLLIDLYVHVNDSVNMYLSNVLKQA